VGLAVVVVVDGTADVAGLAVVVVDGAEVVVEAATVVTGAATVVLASIVVVVGAATVVRLEALDDEAGKAAVDAVATVGPAPVEALGSPASSSSAHAPSPSPITDAMRKMVDKVKIE